MKSVTVCVPMNVEKYTKGAQQFADMLGLYYGVETPSQYAILIGRGLWADHQTRELLRKVNNA